MNGLEDLGTAVAFGRQLKGWSQKDLAREAKLHRVTVSRLEKGARPSRPSEEAVRCALGFTAEGWLEWIAAVGRARREVAGRPDARLRSNADPMTDLMARLEVRLRTALETIRNASEPAEP